MTTSHSSANDIKIVRLYDVPPKVVWDAWADPVQVAKWWGPRGFTITTYHKDMRTGGSWRYTMHGPDGKNYENTTKYLEVTPYSKLVYDHGGHEDRPPLFRVTVLFTEVGRGRTQMEMTSTLPTPEAAAEARRFIKQASGESTWDRLAEYLEEQATGTDKFVIARAFDVPLQKMFEVWTDPKHIAQWSGPKGSSLEFIECDIRPGGGTFSAMSTGGGPKMYGVTRYLEIEKPHRVVYTQHFADENRRPVRHPLSATFPESMLTTIVFSEEGPERTRVTLTWQPQGTITPEEADTFKQAKRGMTQGWSGSFDELEEYLSKLGGVPAA